MGRLTEQRRKFIEEYLQCWNATEAARRAAYKHPNKMGPRLVKVGVIADAIAERIQERAITADEVLARLGEQARSEHAIYIQGDGTVDLEKLLEDGKGHLIKGTRWARGGDLIVEFYDAQSALVHLGKHLELFGGGEEVSGEVILRVVYGERTDDPSKGAS